MFIEANQRLANDGGWRMSIDFVGGECMQNWSIKETIGDDLLKWSSGNPYVERLMRSSHNRKSVTGYCILLAEEDESNFGEEETISYGLFQFVDNSIRK